MLPLPVGSCPTQRDGASRGLGEGAYGPMHTSSPNFVVVLKTEINLFSMGTLHDANQVLNKILRL
jgi:hypothetical protein